MFKNVTHFFQTYVWNLKQQNKKTSNKTKQRVTTNSLKYYMAS